MSGVRRRLAANRLRILTIIGMSLSSNRAPEASEAADRLQLLRGEPVFLGPVGGRPEAGPEVEMETAPALKPSPLDLSAERGLARARRTHERSDGQRRKGGEAWSDSPVAR